MTEGHSPRNDGGLPAASGGFDGKRPSRPELGPNEPDKRNKGNKIALCPECGGKLRADKAPLTTPTRVIYRKRSCARCGAAVYTKQAPEELCGSIPGAADAPAVRNPDRPNWFQSGSTARRRARRGQDNACNRRNGQ